MLRHGVIFISLSIFRTNRTYPRAAWRLLRARMAHYDLGTIHAWVTSGDVG
jgi:hypothetical protein